MSEENTTIQQMRGQIDAANAERDEAKAKATELESRLTNLEREKMGDIERLTAEKNDLAKTLGEVRNENAQIAALRDENGKFLSKFESLYNEGIQSLPEDKREHAIKVTSQGTFADRYESLKGLQSLLGDLPTAEGPKGNPSLTTQPAGSPGKMAEPVNLRDLPNISGLLTRPQG